MKNSNWNKITLLTLFAFFLTCVSYSINVHLAYYDSFEILNSARSIIDSDYSYPLRRYALSAIVYLPSAFFLPQHPHASLLCGLIESVFISVFFLFSFYYLAKKIFSPAMAFLGMLLLGLNPLFLQFHNMIGTDIAAATTILWFIFFYYRIHTYNRPRYHFIGGLLLTATILLKYHLVFLYGFIFLVEISTLIKNKGTMQACLKTSSFWVYFLIMPAVLTILMLTIMWGGSSSVTDGLGFIKSGTFIQQITEGVKVHSGNAINNAAPNIKTIKLSGLFYIRYLTQNLGPLLSFFALLGIFFSLKKSMPMLEKRIFQWGIFFLFVQSILISYKEVRYAFPIYLPLYFWILSGLSALEAAGIKLKMTALFSTIKKLVVILCLLFAGNLAYAEWRQLNYDIYLTPFWEKFFSQIKSLRPDHIFWQGFMTPLFDNHYSTYPNDPLYGIYHLSFPQMIHYLGPKIIRENPPPNNADGKQRKIFFAQTNSILISLYPWRSDRSSLPQNPPPLKFSRFHLTDYPLDIKAKIISKKPMTIKITNPSFDNRSILCQKLQDQSVLLLPIIRLQENVIYLNGTLHPKTVSICTVQETTYLSYPFVNHNP